MGALNVYLGGEGPALLDGGDGVDVALEVQAERVSVQQVFRHLKLLRLTCLSASER